MQTSNTLHEDVDLHIQQLLFQISDRLVSGNKGYVGEILHQ